MLSARANQNLLHAYGDLSPLRKPTIPGRANIGLEKKTTYADLQYSGVADMSLTLFPMFEACDSTAAVMPAIRSTRRRFWSQDSMTSGPRW